MFRLNVEDSLSKETRRLVTKEVGRPDPRPGCTVRPLEVLLRLSGTADVEVSKLPVCDVLHLGLSVELVGPRVLTSFVSQYEPSLHFPHHKNVTERITVSVKLVGYFIGVLFTKDFPGIRLRSLYSVAKISEYWSQAFKRCLILQRTVFTNERGTLGV